MLPKLDPRVLAALVVVCGPALLPAQSGIDARVANTTLKIETSEKLAATATYQLTRVFPRLAMPPVVSLREEPQSGMFYAFTVNGMLFRFPAVADPDPASQELVLNIDSLMGKTSPEEAAYCVVLDPDFATNHQVYINYASNVEDRLTVSRFTLGGNPVEAASTEQVLLRAEPPAGFYNYGGTLEFGPDGMFYISIGDGDGFKPAQVPNSLLGKVLRIDVKSTPAEGLSYAIPSSNPFVGVAGYRPEIWALGLRNPYRFSFDAPTGRLFLGDPGVSDSEEVNLIRKGGNYGWPFKEGNQPYEQSEQADRVDLIGPIHTYGGREVRHAIIGGFVYRGAANPGLVGKYVFGDFIAGKLFALDMVDDTVVSSTEVAGLGGPPVGAVHRDAAGELYVTNWGDNGIYKLAPTAVTVDSQVQGLLGNGTTVDLNADGSSDSADVIEAQKGTKTSFFSRTN